MLRQRHRSKHQILGLEAGMIGMQVELCLSTLVCLSGMQPKSPAATSSDRRKPAACILAALIQAWALQWADKVTDNYGMSAVASASRRAF
jgi:hypothetical protein